MAYRVEFRPRAEQDLETLFRHPIQEAPLRGPQWLRGLEDAISLREIPSDAPDYANSHDRTSTCGSFFTGATLTSIAFTLRLSLGSFGFSHPHGARRVPKRRELCNELA